MVARWVRGPTVLLRRSASENPVASRNLPHQHYIFVPLFPIRKYIRWEVIYLPWRGHLPRADSLQSLVVFVGSLFDAGAISQAVEG